MSAPNNDIHELTIDQAIDKAAIYLNEGTALEQQGMLRHANDAFQLSCCYIQLGNHLHAAA